MTPLLLIALGAVGLGVVVLAVAKPRVALIGLLMLDVSNINGVIQANVGVAPFKPELAIAVVAIIVLAIRRQFRFAWSPVHLGLIVLFAGFAVTFLTTADLATSESTFSDRARGLAYYAIVFVLAMSVKEVKQLAGAAVVVLGLLAGLSVIQEYLLHNSTTFFGLETVPLVQQGGADTPRHAGTNGDPNFWARLLILFVPLALSVTAAVRGRWTKVIFAVLAVSLLLGVYLTQSRGGFIGLAVAGVVWCLLGNKRTRLALIAVPIVLVVLNPILGLSSRLGTLGGNTNTSTAFADDSVVTRARFQLDAIHMFLASPVTGHGIGSYPALFQQFDTTSNFYKAVTIVPAAHNFYLEQLADGGVLLMLAWLVFFGTIMLAAVRAMVLSTEPEDRAERFLAVGIIAGLTGWMVASVFLHLSDFRALLLMAAIAALLDVRARARPRTVAARATRVRVPGRWRAPVLGGLAVLSLVAVPVALSTATTTYQVTSVLAVVRQQEFTDGYSAYALAVVNRGHIPLTFSDIVDSDVTVGTIDPGTTDPAASIRSSQSRLGGAVDVVATASTRAEATKLGAAASKAAVSTIAGLRTGYVLTGTTGAAVQVVSDRKIPALGLAGLGVLLAVLAWWSAWRRRTLLSGSRTGGRTSTEVARP